MKIDIFVVFGFRTKLRGFIMNQNIRKGAALFFSLLLAGSALLPETFAAAAEPVDIDGTKTAFVSSFGRISYGGKSYTAYKSFDEGYAALSDGG